MKKENIKINPKIVFFNQFIKDECERIAKELSTGEYGWEEEYSENEEPGAVVYIDRNMLDIHYTVDSARKYLGSRIYVCLGGPNIFINTLTKEVEGDWGGGEVKVPYTDHLRIDDYCNEMYSISSRPTKQTEEK